MRMIERRFKVGSDSAGCAFGARIGVCAGTSLFARRWSVLLAGFMIGGIFGLFSGHGLQPVFGPLLGVRSTRRVGIEDVILTCGLILMMAAHPCWPNRFWARVASACGVAIWILVGVLSALAGV